MRHSRVILYLAVIAVTGLATLLRWLLDPVLVGSSQYLFYYFSVIFAAIVAGPWAGALAVVLGAVGGTGFFFTTGQLGETTADDAIRLFMFLLFGTVTILLARRLHSARDQAAARAAELAQSLARLEETQGELRESEERFRAVCDNARAAFGILVGTRLVYANPYFSELTGYSVDEIVGMDFRQMTHPSFHQLMVDRARQRLSGESVPNHYEFLAVTKSGEERWVDFSPAVTSLKGQPVIIGTGFDVTERKRAEEALRESEKKFRIVAEHTYDWEFWLAPDGRFLYCSPSCREVTGYDAAAFVGDPELLHRIVHPDDRLRYEEHTGSGGQACTTEEMEFRIIRRDGEIRWIAHTCHTIHDSASQFLGVRGSNRDVTTRKLAEQALREQEAQFRAFFDNAAVGAMQVDTGGRLVQVNNRYCQITGYSREELLGRKPWILAVPEDQEHDRERTLRFLRGETAVYDVEKRYVRKDGRVIWVHVTAGMIRDAAGNPLRSAGIVEDITQRKEAEQGLAAAKESAEQAKAAAEEASRAKDHFLAVLSHELRTPLTPVLATVSMLQEESRFDEEAGHHLEMIRRNVELEARLIDDLLDMTRIARGKVKLDKRPVPLCTVISRAVDVCRPDIDARRLHFGLDLGPAAPYWVEADVARLQQVFWNLLKNAIKFTPHGGCVGIRCRPDGGNEDRHVVAEVHDSGEGIESEALARIFDAFEQARASANRQFGGLGLGLTISKALVEMHGGTIEAHSAGRGKGASFRLTLPLVAPPGTKHPAITRHPAVEARESPSAVLRILFVEDHGDTAKIMKRLLERWGHTVQTAGDVTTALDLAGRENFDLLISDLGLPDGSGLDLMRTLRERCPTPRGIALSGYGMEADVQRSREAGFSEHLTKPVEVNALQAAMQRVVSMP